MRRVIGLDFGTTNSAVAVATPDGSAVLATFADGAQRTATFRSLLHFNPDSVGPGQRPQGVAGPEAIKSYLESGGRGRLIQSMKSYLASRLFADTNLFGYFYTLEDLIAVIIRALRVAAEAQFGDIGRSVVVGRPAHFSGAATEEDDELALNRLRAAFEQAGFEQVAFEFEPVAAAYQYEQQLDHDELVLIGDFGGGTSDFSLIRLGPSTRRTGHRRSDILGVDGLGIAGDAFDSTIVRHAVAPSLGLGSQYRSPFDQVLPVPAWIYERVERWEHLSFLKTKQVMETLQRIKFGAHEPEKIEALMHIVNDDLGYQLYRAVERTKFELSAQPASTFVFRDRPVAIKKPVSRTEFEAWIAPKLAALAACIDRLLVRCNVTPADVGSVFLTGGSSFVPAVRCLFEEKFGADRLRGGEELTTVARGLALRALRQ
ncbi:MAG TPA: Hsp70 family protein [Candidatus Acidoferrales bacterium]|nr:Hsp70 family protein [Candidatus Acidoferrales bacterium]